MISHTKTSIRNLIHLFQSNANPELAVQMSRYMKNEFPFFGIKSPERRAVSKIWMNEIQISTETDLFKIVMELWKLDKREFQYVACDLLKKYKNILTENALKQLKYFIYTKSWWDTVDVLASHPVGQIVLKFPACSQTMYSWIYNKNMWVRRTVILHQLSFKSQTDEKRLFKYCEKCINEDEFFIRKAIGWALRQYSYTNMEAVVEFVRKNEERLSPLSKREALKGFKRLKNNIY